MNITKEYISNSKVKWIISLENGEELKSLLVKKNNAQSRTNFNELVLGVNISVKTGDKSVIMDFEKKFGISECFVVDNRVVIEASTQVGETKEICLVAEVRR